MASMDHGLKTLYAVPREFQLMKAVPLLYHDVVPAGQFQSSGFLGGDADVYKLDRDEFRRHLDAISKTNPEVLLTFDDGGLSFYDCIAPELEQRGWRGYFFIATNWIAEPGFVNASQIFQLRQRGHLIGTHSCSHPARISHCSFEQIVEEWSRSAAILAGILGVPVQMASVPGGYYTHKVAKAAAVAGIRTLFTSEPTLKCHRVDTCVVVGRFTVQRGTSAARAAALAQASALPVLQQSAYWNAKKVLKFVGGTRWLKLRQRMLSQQKM